MKGWTGTSTLLGVALVVYAALMTGAGSAAERGPASKLVGDLGNRAIAVLAAKELSKRQREESFRDLFHQGFDLPLIGRFVLGPHWRRITREQQAAYQEVFAEYVVQTYSARLSAYSGEKLKVVSERVAGRRDILVFAQIERPRGPPLKTSWRVRKSGERHRIIDVMVEGISMAVTQRAEFSAVIHSDGFDGLMTRLRGKIAASATVRATN